MKYVLVCENCGGELNKKGELCSKCSGKGIAKEVCNDFQTDSKKDGNNIGIQFKEVILALIAPFYMHHRAVKMIEEINSEKAKNLAVMSMYFCWIWIIGIVFVLGIIIL